MQPRKIRLGYRIHPYAEGTRTAKKFFCRLADNEVRLTAHDAAHAVAALHVAPLTREPLASVVALIRAPLDSTVTPTDVKVFFEQASDFELRGTIPDAFVNAKRFPKEPSGPNIKLAVVLEGSHRILEELDYACSHLRFFHGVDPEAGSSKFILSDMDDKAMAAGGWSVLSVTLVRSEVRDLTRCLHEERGAAGTAVAASSSSLAASLAATPLQRKVKVADRLPYELIPGIRSGEEELVLNLIPPYFSGGKVAVESRIDSATGKRVFAWDYFQYALNGRDCGMAKVLLRGTTEDIETLCAQYHHRILYAAWSMTVVVLDRPLASYDDASYVGSLLLPLFPPPPANSAAQTHKVQPFSIGEPRNQSCYAFDKFSKLKEKTGSPQE